LAPERVGPGFDVRNLRTSLQLVSHGGDRLAIDAGHEGKAPVREARQPTQRLGDEVSPLRSRKLAPLDVRGDDEGDPFLVGAEVPKLLHGLCNSRPFGSQLCDGPRSLVPVDQLVRLGIVDKRNQDAALCNRRLECQVVVTDKIRQELPVVISQG